jgi:hypothetical protein
LLIFRVSVKVESVTPDALHKRRDRNIAGRQRAVQGIQYLHVGPHQQALERSLLVRLKCSAARAQKATQPKIEFEQTAPTTPGESIARSAIRHGV